MYYVVTPTEDKEDELSEPWNQVFHVRTVHRRIKEEPILQPSVRGEVFILYSTFTFSDHSFIHWQFCTVNYLKWFNIDFDNLHKLPKYIR